MRKYCKFIFRFYVKNIEVTGLNNVNGNKATLLGAFHSNSFLDAIAINTTLSKPVWSLTRGDAFKKPLIKKMLTSFRMLPIFRLSEGVDNMAKNEDTFEECNAVFRKKEQVLIFSEGICKNQIELLPLKKGTARMAFDAWANDIDLEIVPVACNYVNFAKFGKNMTLNFAPSFGKEIINSDDLAATNLITFNNRLAEGIKSAIRREFKPESFSLQYTLGWIFNFPVYFLAEAIAKAKTKGTVFYDSVAYILLIILLPIYWVAIFSFLIWYC